MLGFGVDDVGVLGIDPGGEAVSAGRDEPVGVGDPVGVHRAGWTADRVVVLGPAAHEIERALRLGHIHPVELHQGEIRHIAPRTALVEGLVQPAVVSVDEVSGIVGVDP